MTSILVTGGAGFIGSHVTENLLSRGYETLILDNFSTGTPTNLRHLRHRPSLRIIEGDVTNRKDVKDAVQQSDAIIHLAALTSVHYSLTNPSLVFKVNAQGTRNLLVHAAKSGIRKFILASSTAVYGNAVKLPASEGQPLAPLSPYAASKVRAEEYCTAFHRTLGLNTVILRYFNVYGPRQGRGPYSSVISRFITAAVRGKRLTIFGDGQQTRDFIHVSDAVQATIKALENPESAGETFNIATGIPTTINDLAATIMKLAKSRSKVSYASPRPDEIRYSYGDTTKTKEKLGFTARISLADGLRELLARRPPQSLPTVAGYRI